MKPLSMYLSKVISSKVNATRTWVKVNLFGRTREVQQVLPFGVDSVPVKDMVGLYVKTGSTNADVLVGYVYKGAVATEGEMRIYSLDGDGAVAFYQHLKSDGTCEIGGNVDNMVRYSKLNDGAQNAITAINSNFTTIATALGITLPTVTLDISEAKIEEVKTL